MLTPKRIVLIKSNEKLAHILMLRGDMADHSHPWTPSPMIPLQVAPIADQAFETAIVSQSQKHSIATLLYDC